MTLSIICAVIALVSIGVTAKKMYRLGQSGLRPGLKDLLRRTAPSDLIEFIAFAVLALQANALGWPSVYVVLLAVVVILTSYVPVRAFQLGKRHAAKR